MLAEIQNSESCLMDIQKCWRRGRNGWNDILTPLWTWIMDLRKAHWRYCQEVSIHRPVEVVVQNTDQRLRDWLCTRGQYHLPQECQKWCTTTMEPDSKLWEVEKALSDYERITKNYGKSFNIKAVVKLCIQLNCQLLSKSDWFSPEQMR